MARKLASIQVVHDKHGIANADAIERVDVLGWSCVAKKDEFKVGDRVVYCEIDSMLPYAPWSQFLWKKGDEGKPTYRLRTVKLRGQVSQGLVLPLSVLDGKRFPSDTRENPVYDWHEGQDVTAALGITRYEPPIPAQLAGLVKGTFPCFIPKTDEIRVQAEPGLLDEIRGKIVVITEKADGTSGTFYWNKGEFGVCSRNLELKDDGENTYWKMAKKYDLAAKLSSLTGKNMAIQAEVVGPGIQGNRYGLKEHEIKVFNVFDIDTGSYLDSAKAIEIVVGMNLPMVDTVYCGPFYPEWTVESLLEMAKGKYPGTDKHREGIVIRPAQELRSEVLEGRMSFKVINQEYLLNGGE